MSYACGCSRGICTMSSLMCFNFRLVLKLSGSWTHWSLKILSNWTIPFHSILFEAPRSRLSSTKGMIYLYVSCATLAKRIGYILSALNFFRIPQVTIHCDGHFFSSGIPLFSSWKDFLTNLSLQPCYLPCCLWKELWIHLSSVHLSWWWCVRRIYPPQYRRRQRPISPLAWVRLSAGFNKTQ